MDTKRSKPKPIKRTAKTNQRNDSDMTGYAEFHSNLGPALIYVLKPSFMTPFANEQWYWRYQENNQVNGPFASLEDVTRHATGCMAASGRFAEIEAKNVIIVDFLNKQFLRDGIWTKTRKYRKNDNLPDFPTKGWA